MNIKVMVAIEKDKDGYVAYCPVIQGCYAQGQTYEEVIKNIKEVVALCVEDLKSEKEKIKKLQLNENISLTSVDVSI